MKITKEFSRAFSCHIVKVDGVMVGEFNYTRVKQVRNIGGARIADYATWGEMRWTDGTKDDLSCFGFHKDAWSWIKHRAEEKEMAR